ncbi:hypothetical protein RRG08_048212 [Elysia crispata]|uniref:Uncharacterized protein n=1 Tax=Elysia crispata TaxID=231223 RepID=A0AAE1CPN7_9GAST|nr:hypothetical protein RRG08_048212 [Elysia crispata]
MLCLFDTLGCCYMNPEYPGHALQGTSQFQTARRSAEAETHQLIGESGRLRHSRRLKLTSLLVNRGDCGTQEVINSENLGLCIVSPFHLRRDKQCDSLWCRSPMRSLPSDVTFEGYSRDVFARPRRQI